ncbi:hypothetical protein [Domibacillus aminovorans]|uniref:Uncharacterized protein n=1 Tax=Domibacillus aminovorans TaxID=29332 RepID=A0A177L4Z7_9BACI|nr:hypothetical protein [Domibacillus aminovorans]OAH60738.1 hypothetical protein AWH49_15470 [Domibacillus aminovorans]
MAESAFKGTVLEGRERRYTVTNEKDIEKYVPKPLKEKLDIVMDGVSAWVEDGRVRDGKKPYNSYIVINVDEPYANEVIEIMERHGHWN